MLKTLKKPQNVIKMVQKRAKNGKNHSFLGKSKKG